MKTLLFRCLCTTVLAVAVIQTISAASAADYVFTDLYTLGAPAGFDSNPGNTFPQGVGPDAQIVGGGSINGTGTAIMWNLAAPSGISLDPGRAGTGTDGANQVGYLVDDGSSHAALWSGSAASIVDLNPVETVNGISTPWSGSFAYAVNGGQQVGWGANFFTGNNPTHAMLWNGTSSSYVDLHPAGFTNSEAHGIGGGQEVGFGLNTSANETHALLWSGSAASAVDLNPSGYSYSHAVAAGGQQQVGYGQTGTVMHALLWNSTAQSAIDLGAGFALSLANGKQVGLDGAGNVTLWNGTAASAVNLSALMPTNLHVDIGNVNSITAAAPLYLDTDGNVFGVALDSSTNLYHSFELAVVPEPSTWTMLGMGAASLLALRRNTRKEVRRGSAGALEAWAACQKDVR